MVISSISGTDLTVTRGEDNTTADSHSNSSNVYNTNINTTTVSLQRAYLGTTAAAHSSGDTATSGTYNLFPATGAIQKEARYDLRVYAENESGLGSIQYLVFDDANLKTDSIGAPAVPTGLSLSVASSEQINSSWTKPSDHDTTTAGIQDSPFISIYKVSYTPTATTRVNNFGALFRRKCSFYSRKSWIFTKH